MVLELIRWLRGYVRFVIVGRFPERFLNITSSNRIPVWGAKPDEKSLSANMYVSDYRKIRPLAKKSRVRLKVQKRNGLPFYAKRYKARVGVLVGIFVFSAVVYIMSCFIWSIDVTGLETISHSQLMSVLRDNGFYIGAYKPSLSFKLVSRKTILEIDDIGWMSINVISSHASVEIKEKSKPPKADTDKSPCNVKAKRDGLILRMETLSGVALLKEGSGVVKGQLVVSSVVEDTLGGVSFVRANARIIAQTTHEKAYSLEENKKRYVYEEQPFVRNKAGFLWLEFPVTAQAGNENDSVLRYENRCVELFGTKLPVYTLQERGYEVGISESLSENEQKAVLMNKSALYEAFELSKCKVQKRQLDFNYDNGRATLLAKYICEEDIAYQENITLKK